MAVRSLRSDPPATAPEGVYRLRRAIQASGLSVPRWCEALGLSYWLVSKLIAGTLDPGELTIAFVRDVERLTRGAVPASSFLGKPITRRAGEAIT
jgi:hypothetical protein